MSYKDIARGGGMASKATQGGTHAVEAKVFKLANSLGSLKKLVNQLGTPRDTVSHRHRVSAANSAIQSLAKEIKEDLSTLHEQHGAPEYQAKAKKLLQDFATMLQDYKSTQKQAAEKEASSLPRPDPQAAAAELEKSGRTDAELEQEALLHVQKQKANQALENSIQYNQALIQERDEGIQEITRQIGEVNEMFQDLAVLINDQGVQIVTIDEQITSTAERTKEGAAELVKASKSQVASRNRCLYLWLLAAGFVSLLMIILFA